MRVKTVLVGICALTMVALSNAQGAPGQGTQPSSGTEGMMKLTATMDCPKFEPSNPMDVGDQPGHMLAVGKVKCTYSKGELAGVQVKSEEDTFVMDMMPTRGTENGYGVIDTASGDKAFVKWQGSTTMKDKMPASASGTWSFTGGTGKLKGVKGKGSYKGTYKPDGSATFQITGDYQVAGGGK